MSKQSCYNPIALVVSSSLVMVAAIVGTTMPAPDAHAVTLCPIPMCTAPPAGCSYQPDDTLNEYGCPAHPCGKLVCPESPSPSLCPLPACVSPPTGCTHVPDNTLNEDGCPAYPCGRRICRPVALPVTTTSSSQETHSTQESSSASSNQDNHVDVNTAVPSEPAVADIQAEPSIALYINALYRLTHLGRNPTPGQNAYWLSRLSDKPTIPALYGAMLWQRLSGLDNSL